MTDAPEPPAPRRSRLRLIGSGIALLAVLSFPAAWLLAGPLTGDDGTRETILLLATGSAAALAAAIWVAALSGWSWPVKGAVLGGAAAALLLAGVLLRPTVDGAMKINGFAWRFGETPEDRVAAFAAANAPAPAAPAGDLPPLTAGPGDWPGLLGRDRDGRVPDAAIRTDWQERTPRTLWRHPVGPGWGGFSVVGDRCFTLEQRGEEETVACYDAATGDPLWTHAVPARFVRIDLQGRDGPASTPTFHDGRVFSMGATGVVTCLDARTGSPVWKRELIADPAANITWGLSCSPLVVDGVVVVLPGVAAGAGSAAMGLDAETGETVWQSGDSPASYCSPVAATIGGKRQFLAFEATGLRGLSPAGETRWEIPWTNQPQVNAALPIAVGDRVFLSSGYGTGAALYDVGRDVGGEPREEWVNRRFKLKFNDAVLHEGHLYGLSEGILSCVDVATGDQIWKAGRYGYGQCLLLGTATGDPVLLVTAEDGDLALVNPSPDGFEEVARYSDAAGGTLLSGTCWNHPAYAHGRLYWRNGAEAVCVRLGGEPESEKVAAK